MSRHDRSRLEPGPGRTITIFQDRGAGSPGELPRGLRLLPRGPLFWLDEHRYDGLIKHRLILGSAPDCDIALADAGVSASHCLLIRGASGLKVQDCDSHNGTFVNSARVDLGELPVGALLTVGASTLVAFGERGAHQEIWIGASSLQDYIENAEALYGSVRRAAQAIGAVESTLRGWLKTGKFRKGMRSCG